MLSISGMLGPSSPVSQRTKWYGDQSEGPSEPEERHFSSTPEAGTMPRRHDHQGLQTLLNAATSSEPSSPETSFRSDSHIRSFSEEAATPFHGEQSSQGGKRKAYDDEQTPSPDRERFTASSSPAPKKKRAPRPQYTKEQEDFIWFCRDDLSMSWRKVVELYNNHWHPFEVEPNIRSESGLQSRYYRILDFPVKIRKKKEPSRPDLGLIPSTDRRYPWMGVIKADIEEKKNAERNARYTAASQRDRQVLNRDRGNEERNRTGSKMQVIKPEPFTAHEPPREQHWGSASRSDATDFRGTRGSRVILHTMETDSEVEPERECELSRPSTSSSYSLKSVNSDEDSQDTVKMRFQPLRFTAEGPIRLPPLRRHFTNNTNYDRGITADFRNRSHEKSDAGHVCKISVLNLCI